MLSVWGHGDRYIGSLFRGDEPIPDDSAGAYYHANFNSWLDEMPWLTTPKRAIKWTHEAVLKESRKYKNKSDFMKSAGGAYQAAIENGWLSKGQGCQTSSKIMTFSVTKNVKNS